MGTPLTKLRLFFCKAFFNINTIFPRLRETLYAGRVKLFAEAFELFMHAVFQLIVVGKTASSPCILQGARRWNLEDAKF
jgi:hypothetical protein